MKSSAEYRGPVETSTRPQGPGPDTVLAQGIRWIALLGICAAYLQGGVVKLSSYGGAVGEMQHFGLPLPEYSAGLVILLELGASALILAGYFRWVAALALALFTLMATFMANRFWELPPADRFMVENSFFEHLGLVGGFLLVAWQDLMERGWPGRRN